MAEQFTFRSARRPSSTGAPAGARGRAGPGGPLTRAPRASLALALFTGCDALLSKVDDPPLCRFGPFPPSLTIAAPADGATFAEGEAFVLEVRANDGDDGPEALRGAVTTEGGLSLGEGAPDAEGRFALELTELPLGRHVIWAEVTDPEGQAQRDSVQVEVVEAGDSGDSGDTGG